MRRRFHPLACLGTAAHHVFELAAGGGLVFQSHLRLRGATALYAWMREQAQENPSWWNRAFQERRA